MRKVYQPIATRLVDGGERAGGGGGWGVTVRIVNRYAFRDLSHVALRWTLTSDADTLAAGERAALTVPARDSVDVALDVPAARGAPGADLLLTVRYVLQRGEPFLPAGSAVAWEQMALPGRATPTAFAARK